MKKSMLGIVAALFTIVILPAHAAITVTEVTPWSSGNSPLAADWFELTNTGASAVNITGWKVDDSSNAFASAVSLLGVSNINAGQSVIFVEGTATTANNFITNWFGSSVPAGFTVGYYSGTGIGLSATSDAVNIFNASGVNQASVTFGASDSAAPYQTFDNAAGLTGAISTLSSVGVNGAFVATNSSLEIGSPGSVAAVPEPDSYALLIAGLGFVGFASRKRKV
jgi:Lamin Tail Domain/PEP-CTERM motif